MESKPKNQLIRVAYYDGKMSVDRLGRANGRGAYICNSKECMEKAFKRRAFNRAFSCEISREDIEKAKEELSIEE